MNNQIDIELHIDIESLRETIESALDLNDNQLLFEKLIEFESAKKKINEALDLIKSIEADAKGLILSKANALYTDKWEAIKGKNYKITKSSTGSVFNVTDEADEEFVVLKKTANTKVINQYIKDNGKLPKGLTYNESRGVSLRITVHEDEENTQA